MPVSIVAIVAYAGLYAALHSWLASHSVKDLARRVLGPAAVRWYRLAYNLVAGLTLLPLVALLVWLTDRSLYLLPSPWFWLAQGGQLLAVLGAAYSLTQTDVWHLLGVRQLVEAPANATTELLPGELVVSGMYAWVRHPAYFWALIAMWLTPYMTANRMAMFAVFTLYLYVGSWFEERRLVREYGDAYRAYQRQVPRLIPWRGRAYTGGAHSADVT